jgi:hypothetical protein
MLKDRTPAGLADAIDDMRHFPHNTGGLSMIDEAAGQFARESIEVDRARRAFSRARYAHKDSYNPATGCMSDAAWRQAMTAADKLADTLRAFEREGPR